MQKYFIKDKILEHHPIQRREAHVLARNLFSSPAKREEHFVRQESFLFLKPRAAMTYSFLVLFWRNYRFATAIIIETAYGHQIVTDDDPYLKMAEDLCNYAVPALTPPEGSAVEALPFCKVHDTCIYY